MMPAFGSLLVILIGDPASQWVLGQHVAARIWIAPERHNRRAHADCDASDLQAVTKEEGK